MKRLRLPGRTAVVYALQWLEIVLPSYLSIFLYLPKYRIIQVEDEFSRVPWMLNILHAHFCIRCLTRTRGSDKLAVQLGKRPLAKNRACRATCRTDQPYIGRDKVKPAQPVTYS